MLVISVLALAGCSSLQVSDGFLGVITPYRIDIVQGNVVTKEQVALIKPGMTRNQVRDAIGSPMLTDMFHADRWDYVFTMKRPGTEPQRRVIVAHFKGDLLDRLEAPDLPSEREFVATIAPLKTPPKPRVLELTDEQRKALPVPARAQAASAPATGPARTYPPLEPS
ncbi:outer membrane protein assembly factor BamE [Ideonella sp. A 288]|uniref:outer membrane protein assembly factor BamE n=1 Tax=Ideonella sp. A 288 TaxID=1962181 RepID=UPI001F3E3177|nr:outer membrane protein assembly factor BamE [Ideonella sp. A 288]